MIGFCRQAKEIGKIPIFSFQNFSTFQALISLKFSEFAIDVFNFNFFEQKVGLAYLVVFGVIIPKSDLLLIGSGTMAHGRSTNMPF